MTTKFNAKYNNYTLDLGIERSNVDLGAGKGLTIHKITGTITLKFKDGERNVGDEITINALTYGNGITFEGEFAGVLVSNAAQIGQSCWIYIKR